ncbi:hypothetical protein MKX62_04055 [Sporosarcina sp. FSL K6-5500]
MWEKKMIPLYYDSGSNTSNPWNGKELVYSGHPNYELEYGTVIIRNGIKITMPSPTTVLSPLDQGFYAYNIKTGKQRKLDVPSKIMNPVNYQVAGQWMVLENSGVYLYNLETGELKTVVERGIYGKSVIANVYFPSINHDSVVYTKKGQYMKYDIKSGKTSQLLQLKNPPINEVDNDFSSRHSLLVDDVIVLYGSNVPMTIIKLK